MAPIRHRRGLRPFPPHDLLLGLALTPPSPITVNYSLGSGLTDPCFDPVTLPFADSHHQCRLHHGQFASIHSVYYVLVVSRLAWSGLSSFHPD